jgi:hypothetical protein
MENSDHRSSDQERSRHLKSTAFEKHGLTPESILGEIWYRSRGLQLLGAPIRIFKRLEETWSELFNTRLELGSTQ